MPATIVNRPAEAEAVAAFLAAAVSAPSGLLLEGEPGIGKTTLLLTATDEARRQGFCVLSARSAATESVLAYAGLSDLLAEVDVNVSESLSDVQRLAIDRVLLRAEDNNRASDQREVAASFLTVVERLVGQGPVLIAIDDLQWLDSSSQKIIAFAARRFTGGIGLIAALRTGLGESETAAWLQMPRPEAMTRITLSPFKLAGLHSVVSARLGMSLRRPTMVRIYEASAGNPLYALELARAIDENPHRADLPLSGTLSDLVGARLGTLEAAVRALLLAASCVARPTVELIADAVGVDAEHVFEHLQQAEERGIIAIDGHRLRFEHPLLARGVYNGATTAQRRAMHRRLAELVDQPELRARHLAMAAAHGDSKTLESLDDAAETARIRGAPAAAAELLDLAAELGGDTPERRILAARNHFNAGDAARARELLESCVTAGGLVVAEALALLGVMEILEGSLLDAVEALQRALGQADEHPALRVQVLLPLALAQYNVGRHDEAIDSADAAVETAGQLAEPHLQAQALSMRVLLRHWLGGDVDRVALELAVELEDPEADTSIFSRPTMHNAMLSSFTGDLEEAHNAMRSLTRRSNESGRESDLVFVAFHRVLVELWRGNLSEAALVAEDAVERATLLEGELPRGVAYTMNAAVAAYTGRAEDARRDIDHAVRALAHSGSILLAGWPVALLGFLELSLGDSRATADVLQPLVSGFDPAATEIFVAAFVPDAVEALVALDRAADAEPLVTALERNGRRLDRAWMLATGARCRAMMMAANGSVDDALRTAQTAMAHHERLPMPFERARTQLVLGQIQRRMRQKDSATNTLTTALAAFESMGTPLWAARARSELSRTDVAHAGTNALTPSEQRVAELAVEGMTNRDIAAALFISPKTVEANLARVFRKLDIRSRAQLARHITTHSQGFVPRGPDPSSPM
jgi:DNA-binding NarL/FixJ family response regulator